MRHSDDGFAVECRNRFTLRSGCLLRLIALLWLVHGSLAAAAEADETFKKYAVDWPKHGLRATLEYATLVREPSDAACAGKVSVENYGNRSYAVLFFSVLIYSDARQLIATDRFTLSSNLVPGGKAEISFDPRNPLNPVNLTERYGECPKDMRWARVILDAF